ncbi:MAG TPA: substrate-binding domain-containing protein [Spirochaetia bacterium]|nr:substrate-binding domain-containing protein [Spirochaetia bacterium]HTZ51211.1 substrate-binding domain-containing protein [Spirochaetia bacterium]
MKAGRILILVCLVLAVVAVTGGAQKKVTIGFSMPFIQDSPYFFPYTQAVKKEAAARGWDLIMTDANTDLNTQVNQIEDLVSKGVSGLMIVPLDAAGIVPVIDKVYAQTKGKLPIITSNVMTDPGKLKSLAGFAGPNSYLEGRAMGEYYVNYFKAKGLSKVNYCELTGTAGYSAAIDRRRGFQDRVRELGWQDKFVQFESQPGNWNADTAQKITENWLTTYGDKIQFIYSHNDGMALGVVNALQAAGKNPGDILTNGCDGQTQAVQLVQQGWLLFTVFQSPATDAATAMKVMEKVLKGQKVDYFTYMETPIIDKANADKYLAIVTDIWGSK